MTTVSAPPPPAIIPPAEIVRDIKNLPSAARVLPPLERLLRDENTPMAEIVELIRLDPGIAARLLQVANSAYFSKGSRCTVISEAVNRVGYDQIYELISFAVASELLARPLKVYGLEPDEMWRMSIACGIAAEILAERCDQDTSVAYTIGLLHCVGMVAINDWALQHKPDLALKVVGVAREATESERAAFGFTHAEAGGELLALWDFSEEMTEPVRRQYAPRSSGTHIRMTSLLLVAKWIRTVVCAPAGTPRPPAPETIHLQAVRLNPAQLNTVVGEVGLRLEEIASLLTTKEEEYEAKKK